MAIKEQKIFGVPLKISHVPLGVRVPQVGNRWYKPFRKYLHHSYAYSFNIELVLCDVVKGYASILLNKI